MIRRVLVVVTLLLLLLIVGVGSVTWRQKFASTISVREQRLDALRMQLEQTKARRPFNTLFDKVLVIAIPERRNYITQILGTFGIKFAFVAPVLKKSVVPAEHTAPGSTPLYAGKVACHLSHRKALVQFLDDSGAHTCVVFEDDLKACLDKTFFERRIAVLANELNKCRSRWDILYLGRCHDKCQALRFVSLQLADNARPYCRHAYVVTRAGATTILAKTYPMTGSPGDHMYRALIQRRQLRALVVEPVLFSQNRETLGTTLQNKGRPVVCNDLPNELDFAADPINRITEIVAPAVTPPPTKTRSFLLNEQLDGKDVLDGTVRPKNAFSLVRFTADPLAHRLVVAMAERLHVAGRNQPQAVLDKDTHTCVAVLVSSSTLTKTEDWKTLLSQAYAHDLIPA